MKNINITQAIIFGISIVAIAIAVILFAAYRGGGSSTKVGVTTVWGIINEDIFMNIIRDTDLEKITYIQKNPDVLEAELLKAAANGEAPDLIIFDETHILKNIDRIETIPFKTSPLREYQDTFVDESNLLVTKDGVLGFPFLVDPIIMYYNKDLISSAGYSKPPQTWTEMLAVAPTLTIKDSSLNISRSTIALGAFENINNVKDIYWTLVLQAGNPVIKRKFNEQTEKEEYTSLLKENLNFTLNPAYAATNFFSQFSNPSKTVYSWNRSLPKSQTAFIAGDLVFYLGKASEYPLIKKLNPNLNFDISVIPQSQNSAKKTTYGTMYILSIPKGAKNIKGATGVMGVLTSDLVQKKFAEEMSVASVRRDVLSESDQKNSYQSVFNKSAIIAQGILEPDSTAIDAILKELIDSIISGKSEISDAITKADSKISLMLYEE